MSLHSCIFGALQNSVAMNTPAYDFEGRLPGYFRIGSWTALLDQKANANAKVLFHSRECLSLQSILRV
jgi:hypothetical protein